MVVAHDREFLDRCCQSVLEIRDGRLRSYAGGYSDFERARAEQVRADAKAYDLQQEEIERIEAFIRRFRATASKARLVQSRIRYLEKLPRRERPVQAPTIKLSLPDPPRSGKVPLTCAGLATALRRPARCTRASTWRWSATTAWRWSARTAPASPR